MENPGLITINEFYNQNFLQGFLFIKGTEFIQKRKMMILHELSH